MIPATKKLFLLDAMALIYRAHFALNKNVRKKSAQLLVVEKVNEFCKENNISDQQVKGVLKQFTHLKKLFLGIQIQLNQDF